MKETRGFASLSSSLLARKGQARPAMRPNKGQGLEDLGWNDMGHDAGLNAAEPESAAEHIPAPVQYQAAIAAEFDAVAEDGTDALPVEAVASDEAAPAEVSEPPASAAISQVSAAPEAITPPMRIRSRLGKTTRAAKAKAAFTLRLDGERHLRLRLACAITNRSAQMLVTDALDALLAKMPEVDELAGQVPQRAAKH